MICSIRFLIFDPTIQSDFVLPCIRVFGRDIQSTLSNSNYLGDRKTVRITKRSNCRDSDHKAFCLEIFKQTEIFLELVKVRITQSQISSYTRSSQTGDCNCK